MTAKALQPVVEPATQTIAPGAVYPGAVDHHHPPVALPEGFEAQTDEIITHYPVSKRSASLPLLHQWQETFGYISPEGIEWIAHKLDLQPINILELVTFYPMFRQHPAGKIQVKVCRTLSCALGGAYKLCDYFQGQVQGRRTRRARPCHQRRRQILGRVRRMPRRLRHRAGHHDQRRLLRKRHPPRRRRTSSQIQIVFDGITEFGTELTEKKCTKMFPSIFS